MSSTKPVETSFTTHAIHLQAAFESAPTLDGIVSLHVNPRAQRARLFTRTLLAKRAPAMRTNGLAVVMFVALSGMAESRVLGQAAPTAYKTMDVSAFAGYTYSSSDYFTKTRPSGIVFGTDVTRYFKGPIAPSLEVRVNLLSSPSAEERSYLFGFKGEFRTLPKFARLHPYADVLAGHGTVHFNHPTSGYLGDNSFVVSYGGGVDFDIAKGFSFKADYQRQQWNTGEVSMHPGVMTFGVTYRFPFRPRLGEKGNYKDEKGKP